LFSFFTVLRRFPLRSCPSLFNPPPQGQPPVVAHQRQGQLQRRIDQLQTAAGLFKRRRPRGALQCDVFPEVSHEKKKSAAGFV
jgi:hypothetical protein